MKRKILYLGVIVALLVAVLPMPLPAGAAGSTIPPTSFSRSAPDATNLLSNPGAEAGNMSGWTILQNGGDDWNVTADTPHQESYSSITSGTDVERIAVEALGVDDIIVDPLALEAELCPGEETNADLQICNNGNGAIDWSITEAYRFGADEAAPVASVAPRPLLPGSETAAPPAQAPSRPEGGIESLSGSYLAFDPSVGGDSCYRPGEQQTFCFVGETHTSDYENVYYLMQRFPSDWVVSNIYITGTPSCTVGSFDYFTWWFQTEPYEPIIYHPRYQGAPDVCTAYYCVDVTTGAPAPADVSWYWDGDDTGNPPHNPCSSDGYTPGDWNTCDEAVLPPATIPICDVDLPWVSEAPPSGTIAAGSCQTVTVTFTGLEPGVQAGELHVNSNDPVTPRVTVPITLTVYEPPDGRFDWSPIYPMPGQVVTLSAGGSGAPPLTYTWDMGDGSTESGAIITHTYAAVGNYDVTLTTTNRCGYDVTGDTISVTPPHTLTINVEGVGAVQLDPPGGVYGAGSVVDLSAVPSPGWSFDHWSGDLAGSANPTQLLIDGDKVVTATFTPGATGLGGWVVVANSTLSDFRMINTVDDTVHGPFLQGELGSDGGVRLDVAVTPDGLTALFSNFGDSAVYLVDISNPLQPSLIASVTLPFFAEDIDISADGQYALVADGGSSPYLASIDIPSATLVDVANLGAAHANGVVVAPDGTVVFPDYIAGGIGATLLTDTGEFTYANPLTYTNFYTYSFPNHPITHTDTPRPVNVGLAPDGQTLIVCDTVTSTVVIFRIVEPGVLTFTGVVTGLHGIYDFHIDPGGPIYPATQAVAFAGDHAYVSVNRVINADEVNTGDRVAILNIIGPGQVVLEAGGVATTTHQTGSQLYGVDTIVAAGEKVYVGYPSMSSDGYYRPVDVVDLADYSVTSLMPLSATVSWPNGVAVAPLHLEASLTVSDPAPVPGQVVTYTAVFSNAGPQITGLTVRDVLPPEVEFVGPVTLDPPDAGVVGTPPELVTSLVISAYQQITVTFPVRVQLVAPGTVVYNGVEATGPELSSPSGAAAALVVAPHLTMTKAVANPAPEIVEPITYTIVLTNTGSVDDPAVALTDVLPLQVDFGSWIVQPAGAAVADDVITWVGPLTGGEGIVLAFTAVHVGGYDETVTNTATLSGVGQSASAAAAYTTQPNQAPELAPIGPWVVDELVTLAFTATASDANMTPLTFTLAAGSVGTITPAGAYSWTPSEAEGPGMYTATVQVSDGELSDTETIIIAVADVNVAPVLGAIGNQVVDALATLVFTATATDADLPANILIFFLAAGAPWGATIDPMTGVFSWTPSLNQTGVYTVTVQVSDGMFLDAETITITVNRPVFEVFLPIVLRNH